MAVSPATEVLGGEPIDAADGDGLKRVMQKTDTEERADGHSVRLSPDEVATAVGIISCKWKDVLRVARALHCSVDPLTCRDVRRAMEQPQGADIAPHLERCKKAAAGQQQSLAAAD
jgi:hypothetical protein